MEKKKNILNEFSQESFNKAFSNHLKKIITNSKTTQKAIADFINKDSSTIHNRLYNHNLNFNAYQFTTICNNLNIDINEIIKKAIEIEKEKTSFYSNSIYETP